MAESVINRHFPSQVVSDLEKMSHDYGMKVAKAIQHEWFSKSHGGGNRYNNNISRFHKLRLYARGEQSIQKYKDELSINGDLSYLNLDWTPVPIISKFVDIVVNGIAERLYKVKAFSQDPYGVVKRTEYMKSIEKDMKLKDFYEFCEENFGIAPSSRNPDTLPTSDEEFKLHMQLTYKQEVEIAEEQAIETLMKGNRYSLIKRRFYQDLTVLGIGAAKTGFNTAEGVTIEYVDPANLVYSYTDSPYFEDLYYVGEVKSIPINELKKQFPYLDHEELEKISKTSSGSSYGLRGKSMPEEGDNNKVDILYFNYKTYMNEVYKIKQTGMGGQKAMKKDDSFNPPKSLEGKYDKLSKSVECLYEGAYILGADKLIKWEKADNMMRVKSDYTKVKMNYSIVAPRMYEGRIESLVGRITGFADMIQLTHLKIQQVLSRMTPDGVFLDVDGLAEVDLGNGTNYNPQEALNMFFQTGSIVGRSMTIDGDGNPGKIPIQEIQSGAGSNKMQQLIGTYNYYLQMIRDVTGLNEASDGSTPAERSLVGVQKMAAANSNTACRHILQSGMFLTADIAEQLSLRISDIIEYSPTKKAFIEAIGAHNIATLEEMSNLHLYDFGIFLELEPDEEDKQLLENNIQSALGQQGIELEDAIDLRQIRNIKLANQMLKLRRKKKGDEDQARQLQQTQAQGQAQEKAAAATAKAEIDKGKAVLENTIKIESIKTDGQSRIIQQEGDIKEKLMQLEFQYSMQLKQLEAKTKNAGQLLQENRKDDRTKMQATQQSAMIDQKENQKPSQNFESQNNELGGFEV
tara:strand:- start:1155 stop:3554 length:2400 start_codon:yes stop_codon:yes gene_type:complete